ncbi:MAG TPA: type VI secretion system baseplate subunit TssF, partial [Planctomycetota bacterium]|nr:type VI secretion system baseplate subunit TssF [Planctomycetota bacterium]
MRDDLLPYYERELTYLRQGGAEFAEKYPKIASRLALEADKCGDPQVERLLEGFAFLAARIHRKLDDELPEVTDGLLGVLYPELLAPVPSMSLVQAELDFEQGCPTTGVSLPRHTTLHSKKVQDVPCRFRTAYPVTLWPVEVAEAKVEMVRNLRRIGARTVRSAIRLRLRCLAGLRFPELEWMSLRFYLHGEGRLVYRLHELLFRHGLGGEVVRPGKGGV